MFHKIGALAEKALFLGSASGNSLTAGVCSMLFLPKHVEQADVMGQSKFCIIKSWYWGKKTLGGFLVQSPDQCVLIPSCTNGCPVFS